MDFIYPDVDMATRTARVRIVLQNPDPSLSPGIFVKVALKVPMGDQLVIPTSGILQSGTRQIAFADRGNGYLEPAVAIRCTMGDQMYDEGYQLAGGAYC